MLWCDFVVGSAHAMVVGIRQSHNSWICRFEDHRDSEFLRYSVKWISASAVKCSILLGIELDAGG